MGNGEWERGKGERLNLSVYPLPFTLSPISTTLLLPNPYSPILYVSSYPQSALSHLVAA